MSLLLGCGARITRLGYIINRHRCVTRVTELPEVLLMALVPALAVAQTPPSVEANAALAAELQEITVTATRREVAQEAVPYSLSVVSADDIERSGATDLASLAKDVPGLSMFDFGARLSAAPTPIAMIAIKIRN